MPTREFHRATPEEKLIYKENSYKNLRDFQKVMNGSGIKFWITCGLMLGLYRQGDMPKNDEDDIDVNIWARDMPMLQSAIHDLEAIGFEVGSRRRGFDGEISSLALRRDKCQIDVKAMYERDDRVFILMYVNKDSKPRSFRAFVFPRDLFVRLGIITWRKLALNCPIDAEKYLLLRYGPDWRTPKPKFETWTDWRNPNDNPCLDVEWTKEK